MAETREAVSLLFEPVVTALQTYQLGRERGGVDRRAQEAFGAVAELCDAKSQNIRIGDVRDSLRHIGECGTALELYFAEAARFDLSFPEKQMLFKSVAKVTAMHRMASRLRVRLPGTVDAKPRSPARILGHDRPSER